MALCLIFSHSAISKDKLRNIEELIKSAESWNVDGNAKRTLPFASHWNTGQLGDGFTPDYQISLLEEGYPILPWVQLPVPGESLRSQYYSRMIAYLETNRLPFTLVSTQWERLLVENDNFFDTAKHIKSAKENSTLTPDGPVEDWYRVGVLWGKSDALTKLVEAYPTPPFVLFLSNNEQRKTRWDISEASQDEAEQEYRKWDIRYRSLFMGLRTSLGKSWRQVSLFAGYNNFVPTFMGRWPGWKSYSSLLGNEVNPLISHWDGSSIPYYLHDWNDTNDFSMLSPQVESMSWYPVMMQLLANKRSHWFELSVWDGYSERTDNHKHNYYKRIGQKFDPDRYKGLLRFGMWLTRPRVIREFRHWNQARAPIASYFQSVLESTKEVHDNETLARFWLHGDLIPNHARRHPYTENLPPTISKLPRWFGHSEDVIPEIKNGTKLNETTVPVFDIVLKMPDTDEYLVFAYSPDESARTTTIAVNGLFRVKVPVTTSGNFHKITRTDGNWHTEKLL